MLLCLPSVLCLGMLGGCATGGSGGGGGNANDNNVNDNNANDNNVNDNNGNDNAIAEVTQRFQTSLHYLRSGKETFYVGTAEEPGFFEITQVPFADLDCIKCHAATYADGTPVDNATYEPGCADCHADPANPSGDIPASVCYGCHGRQGAEANALAISDVHRDAGFECTACHGDQDMHGTDTEYASFLDPDNPQVECEDCHREGGIAPVPPASVSEHATHAATIDCPVCHMQGVTTCYNCHFESELAGAGKRFFAPPRSNFIFLVNREGKDKIYGASFQSLVYDGNTFVAFGPYYGHTITAEGRVCSDCHANFGGSIPAIEEFNDTGTMTITTWDDAEEGPSRLTGPSGVIPMPTDWKTAFQFAWLDYAGDPATPVADTDPTLWTNIANGTVDQAQMLYATPLTADQMNSIGMTGP